MTRVAKSQVFWACGLLFSTGALAQQPQTSPAQTQGTGQGRGCLAVADIGTHGLRNFMLGGVAGALLSKQQYQVVDAVDYPAKIGQKFHGNDLQTIQTSGIHIVILGKNYTPEDLHQACR